MQASDMFRAQVGGSPTVNSTTGQVLIAATAPNEQVEVKVTLRTQGRVIFTTREGNTSPTNGIQLPLDEERMIRLGPSQRLYLTSTEIVAQTVDVIIQPTEFSQQVTDVLKRMNGQVGQAIEAFGVWQDSKSNCPPKKFK